MRSGLRDTVPSGRRTGRGLRVAAVLGMTILGLVLLGGFLNRREAATDAGQVLTQAQTALKAGQLAAVATAIERLERLRPPTAEDRLLRAEYYKARGEIDAAIRELDSIPDDSPHAPAARLRAGQMELRRDRMRAAEAYLRRAIALDHTQVQAHRELVYILGMQLRQKEQDDCFHALAALTPLTARDLLIWCMPRGSSTWDPHDHVRFLSAFVAADSDDRWSRLALVEMLRRSSRLDEAEATLAVLPESDPEARVLRAALATDRGDHDAAARILAEGPDEHPGLAQERGQRALFRRDAAEALRQFQIALQGGRSSREVIRGLAQALRQMGQEDEAARYDGLAQDLDRLTTLIRQATSPKGLESPELPRRLGAACAAVGRVDEARGWYQLAVVRDPLDREAQEALHALGRESPPKGAAFAPVP